MPYSGTLRMVQDEAMTKIGFENGRKIQKFKEKELQKLVLNFDVIKVQVVILNSFDMKLKISLI